MTTADTTTRTSVTPTQTDDARIRELLLLNLFAVFRAIPSVAWRRSSPTTPKTWSGQTPK